MNTRPNPSTPAAVRTPVWFEQSKDDRSQCAHGPLLLPKTRQQEPMGLVRAAGPAQLCG